MAEVKRRNKKLVYITKVKWLREKTGKLSSFGKPEVEVATPPEFGGEEGIWAPEELFVASVNSCIMTTFLYFANKEKLKFISYESEAEGLLERGTNGFWFSHITLYPKIVVKDVQMMEKTRKMLETVERYCLISNSIRSKVMVNPKIVVKERM